MDYILQLRWLVTISSTSQLLCFEVFDGSLLLHLSRWWHCQQRKNVTSLLSFSFVFLLFQALARHSITDRERDQRKQRRLQKEVESKDDQDDSASVTSSIQSTEASSVANDPAILDEK